MKTLLHIAASPRTERSHSRKLANEFIAAFQKEQPGYEVKVREVGSMEQGRFGEGGAAAKFKAGRDIPLSAIEQKEWDDARAAFEELDAADKVVISTPMWNFSIPYHLKNWIDQVMQPNWTFGVDPEKGFVPLMGGKPLLLVVASGSGYDTPEAAACDMLRPYMRFWAQINGFKLHELAIEGTNVPELFAKNQEKVRKELAGLAAKF